MPYFLPENYGATGEPHPRDIQAVQNAINAASVHGGTVYMEKEYGWGFGGVRDFSEYKNIHYAWLISSPNVKIEGPGRVVPLGMPEPNGNQFCIFAIGDITGDYPGATGTFLSNVGIEGLTFDNSSLTVVQRQQLGQTLTGGCVVAYYTEGLRIRDLHIIDGFGKNGAIALQLSSKDGLVEGCEIDGAIRNGIWLDGTWDSWVVKNTVRNALAGGIGMAANTDNDVACTRNWILNNDILDCDGVGISIQGTWNHVLSNFVETYRGMPDGYIRLFSQKNVAGEYPTHHNFVDFNILNRAVGSVYTRGLRLGYSNEALNCYLNFLRSNFIGPSIGIGYDLQAGAIQNVIVQDGRNLADTAYAEVEEGQNTIS